MRWLVASRHIEDRPVIRHLIAALALLHLISACGSKQEPPAGPAEPEPAPTAQSDSEVEPVEISYAQILQLQGVTFNVISPNQAASNTVTVSTTGLEIDNSAWSQEVDGIVTGAEVADLNVDGSPEVYVYVKSSGADAMGAVLSYVANNRKSLSSAFMAPLSDTPGAEQGYQGQDEFAVLEGVLGRRFPIHDEAGAPTGKTRQLHYVLVAGEAGWFLKVDKMLEF
jgi:hypothetical protein